MINEVYILLVLVPGGDHCSDMSDPPMSASSKASIASVATCINTILTNTVCHSRNGSVAQIMQEFVVNVLSVHLKMKKGVGMALAEKVMKQGIEM